MVREVYSFGSNSVGQLGIGSDEDKKEATLVNELLDKKVCSISSGARHSAVVTEEGLLLTWGNNEYGELGRSRRLMIPQRVDALESHIVINVACGDSHTICCTDMGLVYSFGNNKQGQLGTGDFEPSGKPKLVKEMENRRVSIVAAGSAHSLCLTKQGETFSFGCGSYGQLGKGDMNDRRWPVFIEKLTGVPVVSIVCGSHFSSALSVSGTVYTWGSNNFGQLGLGDFETRTIPTMVRSLRGKQVVEICAGESHMLARSNLDNVYSWGNGSVGQTGLDEITHQPYPRPIDAFIGVQIGGIAAGRRHSSAFRITFPPSSKMVYTWGSNASNQLGHMSRENRLTPLAIDQNVFKGRFVEKISCGGDFSIVMIDDENFQLKKPEPLFTLNLSTIRNLVDTVTQTKNTQTLIETLQTVFSSPALLNASFLLPNHFASSSNSGVDLNAVRESYLKLMSLNDARVLDLLVTATDFVLSKARGIRSEEPEILRMYLIILENPLILHPNKTTLPLLERLTTSIQGLSSECKSSLKSWWSVYPSEFFVRLVDLFNKFLAFILSNDIFEPLVSVVQILNDLHEINNTYEIVPHDRFYNQAASKPHVLKNSYENWRQSVVTKNSSIFSLISYPFLLTPQAKELVLHHAAELAQREEMQNSVLESALSGEQQMPFLLLIVNRDNLIQDTASQIMAAAAHPQYLRRPLKVVFSGEEGVDEGGVKKEFFQLVIRGIFSYDMFEKDEQSHLYWFNSHSMEPDEHFKLVGIILGLAIYNGVILDIHFPRALYCKLLKKAVGLTELTELHPILGRSLQYLLEYQGGDEEDIFGLTFQVTKDNYGETKHYDLKENGRDIVVNTQNKKEYIDLHVQFLLTDSISRQYNAFEKGFRFMMDPYLLGLFRSDELELLICGSREEIDLDELKKGTRYAGGFTRNHPVVTWFWEALNEMEMEEKKKFLFFATGSDRVPIQGLSSVSLIVQRNGDDQERLPTAQTCYNVILLPEYFTKEKLKEKLSYSIKNPEGFGLA